MVQLVLRPPQMQAIRLNADEIVDEKPKKTVCQRIKSIAKVAIALVVSAIAFWMNPAIFFVSFAVGVAFNNVMQKAIMKIKDFIKHHKWPVLVGCGIVCFLSLPVFLATASATWALFCGSYLSGKAQAAFKKKV